MNEIRVSVWNVLRLVLVTGMVVLSALACDTGSGGGGGNSKKSSAANMTALEVTIGGTDYPANIDGATATVVLSEGAGVPDSVTVKAVTLSAKATGLKNGDTITLDGGRATVTITAEDGATTTDYTLVVTHRIVLNSVLKTDAANHRRYTYVLFTVASGAQTDLGRYKLALTEASEDTPTAEAMTAGAGVSRGIGATEKRVLLAYTLTSNIGGVVETGSSYLNKVVKHDEVVDGTHLDVDGFLLSPGTEYAVYGLKSGGSTVVKLGQLSTDAFDAAETLTIDDTVLDPSLTGEYPIHADDTVAVFPISMVVHVGLHTHELAYSESLFVSHTFNGGALVGVTVSQNTAVLVHSSFVDGDQPLVGIGGGTKITNWMVIVPTSSVTSESSVSFRNPVSPGHPYYTMTFTTD